MPAKIWGRPRLAIFPVDHVQLGLGQLGVGLLQRALGAREVLRARADLPPARGSAPSIARCLACTSSIMRLKLRPSSWISSPVRRSMRPPVPPAARSVPATRSRAGPCMRRAIQNESQGAQSQRHGGQPHQRQPGGAHLAIHVLGRQAHAHRAPLLGAALDRPGPPRPGARSRRPTRRRPVPRPSTSCRRAVQGRVAGGVGASRAVVLRGHAALLVQDDHLRHAGLLAARAGRVPGQGQPSCR